MNPRGSSQRDQSRSRILAALRKARQRRREKNDDFINLEVALRTGDAAALAAAGKLLGIGMKPATETLLARVSRVPMGDVDKVIREVVGHGKQVKNDAIQAVNAGVPSGMEMICDQSRLPAGAAGRKARERVRLRKAGLKRVEIKVSAELKRILEDAGAKAGVGVKRAAEAVLTRTAHGYLAEIERLARKAGETWRRAQPYLGVASYLTKPGEVFRHHDRVLREEDWRPIQADLANLYALIGRWGWSPARIRRFLEHSAARLGDTPGAPTVKT